MELFEAQVQAELEKRLNNLRDEDLLPIVSKRYAQLVEEHKQLQDEHEQVASDYARLTDAEGNYEMKDAAKLLKYKRSDGKQVGRNELFSFLRDLQVLNRNNTPSQSAVDNGWFDEVTGTYVQKGVEYPYVKTVVTPKGLERIRRFMEDSFETWWAGE